MFFKFRLKNKTIKELRKNQGLTAKELAAHLKLEPIEIMKVDDIQFKNISEPLKSKLWPILSGEYTDKIPWL